MIGRTFDWFEAGISILTPKYRVRIDSPWKTARRRDSEETYPCWEPRQLAYNYEVYTGFGSMATAVHARGRETENFGKIPH
jgi:hypothetical protein